MISSTADGRGLSANRCNGTTSVEQQATGCRKRCEWQVRTSAAWSTLVLAPISTQAPTPLACPGCAMPSCTHATLNALGPLTSSTKLTPGSQRFQQPPSALPVGLRLPCIALAAAAAACCCCPWQPLAAAKLSPASAISTSTPAADQPSPPPRLPCACLLPRRSTALPLAWPSWPVTPPQPHHSATPLRPLPCA